MGLLTRIPRLSRLGPLGLAVFALASFIAMGGTLGDGIVLEVDWGGSGCSTPELRR